MGTIEAVVIGDRWYKVTGPQGVAVTRVLAGSSFEARRIVQRNYTASQVTDFFAEPCKPCDCSPVKVSGEAIHSLTCAMFDGLPLVGGRA